MILRVMTYTLTFLLLAHIGYGQKRSLVIGIAEYPDAGRWPSLSSDNDLKYVEKTLQHLGIKKKNIEVIQNEQATKSNIDNAFNKLLSDSQKGDFVYIHFSGHGQQVVDNNGDEIDGLDEALVPFDSPLYFSKGSYEGERLVRDDELNVFTDRLRTKLGPTGQIVFVIDACHSGTGTRGMGKARGTQVIMGPEGFSKTNQSKNYGFNNQKNANQAPMACFFGSSPNELNYETIDHDYNAVGSLTLAISQVLINLKGKSTFGELYEKVRSKMNRLAPKQNPVFEGPDQAFLLDNQKVQYSERIQLEKHLRPGEMIFNIGNIGGVFKGSQLAIYDLETDKRVAKANVLNAQLTTCLVKVLDSGKINMQQNYFAKILSKTSPPCRIDLNNQLEKSNPWNEVLNDMDKSAVCSFTQDIADLYISACGPSNDHIQIATKEGDIVYEGKDLSKADWQKHKINKSLKSFALGKYLREADYRSDQIRFEVEVIPMAVVRKGRRIVDQYATPSSDKRGKDGLLHFKNGDYISIRVKNTGKEAAYFSIMDIQADNTINMISPSAGSQRTAEDFYLEPGKEYTTDFPIQIAPPFGNELIKVIASDQVIDILSSLNGSNRGSTNHPLEQILAEASSETRGGTPSLDINSISTAEFLFTIEQ